VEGKIVLKFNVQIHKTLAEKYREELNDLASSNQIVKTTETWKEELTSSSIYQKKKLFINRERLRKLYRTKVLAMRGNLIY